MKRLVLLTFAVMAFCLVSGGEAVAQGFGIKGGLLWSDLRGTPDAPDIDYGRRSSLSGGIYLNLDLMAIKLRPELLYARRGAKLAQDGAPTTSAFELNYIEVPVLLVVGRSPNFFLGPYGAYRASSNLVTGSGDTQVSVDVSDSVESIDYGVVLGVGMQFGGFGVEARYTLGLRRIFKAVGGEEQGPDLKHQALGLFASVGF